MKVSGTMEWLGEESGPRQGVPVSGTITDSDLYLEWDGGLGKAQGSSEDGISYKGKYGKQEFMDDRRSFFLKRSSAGKSVSLEGFWQNTNPGGGIGKWKLTLDPVS